MAFKRRSASKNATQKNKSCSLQPESDQRSIHELEERVAGPSEGAVLSTEEVQRRLERNGVGVGRDGAQR